MKLEYLWIVAQFWIVLGDAFVPFHDSRDISSTLKMSTRPIDDANRENRAMTFLRKIGKVGGAANRDFTNVIGIDEGPAGKSAGHGQGIRKAKGHYKSCTVEGVVDTMSEPFPVTSCGSQWQGVTDRVMGGVSSGSITREMVDGRMANVLRGKVIVDHQNRGFVQMATDLSTDPSISSTVDASDYDGIELEVQCHGQETVVEHFNVHVKNTQCARAFSSYRATFELTSNTGKWETIRLPWSDFIGHGPGAEDAKLDTSTLRRLGILAIGREMTVDLAVGSVQFYRAI